MELPSPTTHLPLDGPAPNRPRRAPVHSLGVGDPCPGRPVRRPEGRNPASAADHHRPVSFPPRRWRWAFSGVGCTPSPGAARQAPQELNVLPPPGTQGGRRTPVGGILGIKNSFLLNSLYQKVKDFKNYTKVNNATETEASWQLWDKSQARRSQAPTPPLTPPNVGQLVS